MLLPAGILATPTRLKVLNEDQKIMHILNRLGFGARPGDIEKVERVGIKRYIEQQLNPALIGDAACEAKLKELDIFSMTSAEVFGKYPNPGVLLRVAGQNDGTRRQGAEQNPAGIENMADEREKRRETLSELYAKYDLRPANRLVPQIAANRILRAVYSERQLQEVMVDFWQNHFNVYAGKAVVRWYIPSYERDVLRKHALGNFRDLVVGTAKHPAMLFFLDNFQSQSPNVERPAQNRRRARGRNGRANARRVEREEVSERMRPQRGINENYARELMELHTMGVDSGYTQADIQEVAKAFTGWTIVDPRGVQAVAEKVGNRSQERATERIRRMGLESGEFYFNARRHVSGPKMVLGHTVNEGGMDDGLKVIDILVKHPATARFIARKLAVKFVSDRPGEDLVDRVAAAFTRSNGDIKTTLRAIFEDPEFFDVENYRAKIKTPFELTVSSIRQLGGNTNGGPAMLAMLNKLGEVPYGFQAPTGYPDTAEDWVNTGALLERINFAVAIASNRIPGTRVDLGRHTGKHGVALLDSVIDSVLGGEISPKTRELLIKQAEAPLPDVTAGNVPDYGETPAEMRRERLRPPSGDPEIVKAVSLVLGTPEFQRQ